MRARVRPSSGSHESGLGLLLWLISEVWGSCGAVGAPPDRRIRRYDTATAVNSVCTLELTRFVPWDRFSWLDVLSKSSTSSLAWGRLSARTTKSRSGRSPRRGARVPYQFRGLTPVPGLFRPHAAVPPRQSRLLRASSQRAADRMALETAKSWRSAGSTTISTRCGSSWTAAYHLPCPLSWKTSGMLRTSAIMRSPRQACLVQRVQVQPDFALHTG